MDGRVALAGFPLAERWLVHVINGNDEIAPIHFAAESSVAVANFVCALWSAAIISLNSHSSCFIIACDCQCHNCARLIIIARSKCQAMKKKNTKLGKGLATERGRCARPFGRLVITHYYCGVYTQRIEMIAPYVSACESSTHADRIAIDTCARTPTPNRIHDR